MKAFTAGLDTLLATRQFVHADLYEFTLQDGTVLRYTTADTDVFYNGSVYTSKGPYFDQVSSGSSRSHSKAGLDADEWTVVVAPTATDPITGVAYPAQIYGHPWMVAVRVGALDGAAVDIHRGYWPSWPTRPFGVAGPLVPPYAIPLLFSGFVTDVTVGRTQATIKLESWLGFLQRQMPRHVYSTSCRWTLFDAGCSLVASGFQASGTVTGVNNDGYFNTNVAVSAGYYALGKIQFLSGQNEPFSRAIAGSSGPPTFAIQTRVPFDFQVNIGDTFFIWPGCDKTLPTCTNKFNNAINFGGFPYVPPPETSM